jgi:hypothetical protein
MKVRPGRVLSIAVAGAVTILVLLFLLYASKRREAMLFYYGGAVEAPNENDFAVMNPFRDRASEKTAERLIADLRTSRCQTIVKEFSDDPHICPILQTSRRSVLVWRRDGESQRILVYDIRDKQARLRISFSLDEGGFGVRSLSLIR